MKKAVAGIVLMIVAAVFAFASGKKEGNGIVTTREHRVPYFERVHVGSNADVRIHLIQDTSAQETLVVVSADSNLHEFIEIRHAQKHRAVEIRTPRREKSFPRFSVDVYCPAITGVGLAGTASVTVADPLVTESFAFDMAGSGSLTIRGSAENVSINITGDGTFDGQEFKAANASAHVVGEGNLIIWADALAVNVVGNATISYRGNPVLDITGVGNGRFVRIGE